MVKLLFENWREYISEQRELIQEFKESDKEAILADGDRYTISYEVELLSEDAGDGGYRDPDLPSLEDYARQQGVDHHHFQTDVAERTELETFYEGFLELHDEDHNGIIDLHVSEDVLAVPPGNQNELLDRQIVKFEIAIRLKGMGGAHLYKIAMEDISEDGSVAANEFVALLLSSPKVAKELADHVHSKTTQLGLDLDPEDDEEIDKVIHTISGGLDNVGLFKKYVFDLDGTDAGFPENSHYSGTLISLEDFFGALMMETEFSNVLDEVDTFLDKKFMGESSYPMIDTVTSLGYELGKDATTRSGHDAPRQSIWNDEGTPSEHLVAMAVGTQKAADEFIEAQADEEYEEFESNPVEWFNEIYGEEHLLQSYESYYDARPPDYYDDYGYGEGSWTFDEDVMNSLLFEHLPNFMRKYSGDIKLEEDASLAGEPHVEFSMDYPAYITGLEAGLEYLETFFTDFENQTNFSMDGRTGMHTNVGILDEEGDAIGDYNLMKALLFLNHQFATKGFESRAHSRWAGDVKGAAIDKIADLFNDEISREEVRGGWQEGGALYSFVKKDFDKIERALSSVVASAASYAGSKSIGFNVNYIGSRKYVEFRYPGHSTLNFDNVKDATLYYAHIIKLATNPEYKRDEYLKKLVGFVNNLKYVERSKVNNIEQIKALKAGTLLSQPYGQTETQMQKLYLYLTSETEREMGRNPDLGRGSELIQMKDLDQEFFIYKGLKRKNKTVVLERIAVRGDTEDRKYVAEIVEKPMVLFEKQLKRGNIRPIDVAQSGTRFWKQTNALIKLVFGVFEVLRKNPIKDNDIRQHEIESQDIWNLRDRINSIKLNIKRNYTWNMTDEDRELLKKYEDKKLPYSVPSDEQQELRQMLRRLRVEEEEAPVKPPSERGGIWDLVRPSTRAQPDEERHVQSRERPRLPPISRPTGPIPYEMGYEAAANEGEEESLKIMKQQRKFATDGAITVPESHGGPWSGTVEEFERFWKLGAQRGAASREG